jgi:alpha-beta hydrolase superfamily lysophospholipase
VRLSTDFSLRTLSAAPLRSKGTVLLLHGFPETMYAFKPVAEALSAEYEVHAFDWPGYGQSSALPPTAFLTRRWTMPMCSGTKSAPPASIPPPS